MAVVSTIKPCNQYFHFAKVILQCDLASARPLMNKRPLFSAFTIRPVRLLLVPLPQVPLLDCVLVQALVQIGPEVWSDAQPKRPERDQCDQAIEKHRSRC